MSETLQSPGATLVSGRVTVVGSANLDLVVEVARLPAVGETLLGSARGSFAGGKGLNQARAAARSGATTVFCGAVGADEHGDELQRAAHAAGVTGDLIRVDSAPTGVAHIFSLPDGDNSIVVAAGANAALSTAAATAAVRDADVVLAQLEVPVPVVAAAFAAGRARGAITVLNAAPAHPDTAQLLNHVDVLIVNESECDELGGITQLRELPLTVIRTLGGAGAEVHRPGADPAHIPAFPITPVDTTGAGDAFCGAFAAALAGGADVDTAVLLASAAGAITAQHLGASAAALTPSALQLLTATRSASA